MMAVWCEGCGAQVLLWSTDIKGIVNTADGAIVAYRCGSGHDGATLIRRRAAARGVASVAAAR
jgi:hypothetical protein